MEIQSVIKNRLNELIDKCAPYEGLFPQRTKLRLEKELEAGKGQYRFDLKQELYNNLSTFGLKRDDVIVPSAVGIMIAIGHSVNGTWVEKLYPFAPFNDGTNPSVHPVGFANDGIRNLYNGNVQWTVGSTVAWEAYPMENFLKIPRQQGAFVLDSNDAAVQEGIEPEFSIEACLELLYTKYFIAGTQDHVMTVNFDAAGLTFPLADAGGVTTDYKARLVLYMDAFIIKNGTKMVDVSGNGPFKGAAWAI